MAEAEYPVYRSDANNPEEENPWKEHVAELKREHADEKVERAATKQPKQESDAERRERYEEEMNEAGKHALRNARGIPPELLKPMDDPASTMGEA